MSFQVPPAPQLMTTSSSPAEQQLLGSPADQFAKDSTLPASGPATQRKVPSVAASVAAIQPVAPVSDVMNVCSDMSVTVAR